MISKLLFSLVLAVTPIVSISNQVENTDFDTFQTANKYRDDFNYLTNKTYRISLVNHSIDDERYVGQRFLYYAFPNSYNIQFTTNTMTNTYTNDYYSFYVFDYTTRELKINVEVTNYIGVESVVPFIALDYVGMNQVIEHDKIEHINDITIYSSFYKFFTGFFPENVVTEYHGIFTFVIVAFLFFLVFGFVFFLFRVIRRLVGFK